MVMQHMLKVMQHMLLGAQHMLRVMQHMCDSVRIKLSQPNLAEVGVGAELGNFQEELIQAAFGPF